MKAKDLIKKTRVDYILEQIQAYTSIANCDHTWESHGYGYLCLKCGYYTGLNSELNNLVSTELEKKKNTPVKKKPDEKIRTPDTCNNCIVQKDCYFSRKSTGCYARLWKFLVVEKI